MFTYTLFTCFENRTHNFDIFHFFSIIKLKVRRISTIFTLSPSKKLFFKFLPPEIKISKFSEMPHIYWCFTHH